MPYVASFEDPKFYDTLERARVQAGDRVGMLSALGRLLQQTVTLLSMAAGVMAFSPLLLGVMVLAVIPAFLGESHFAFLSRSHSVPFYPCHSSRVPPSPLHILPHLRE